MNLEEKDKYTADHLMNLEPDTLRYMVADLTAEVERLKEGHDFDAKRLRVLARAAGCEDGVPDDETAVACAGTVLGMIRRNVEQITAERDRMGASLGQINAVCLAVYPDCSGTPLADMVGRLSAERGRYKAVLERFAVGDYGDSFYLVESIAQETLAEAVRG